MPGCLGFEIAGSPVGALPLTKLYSCVLGSLLLPPGRVVFDDATPANRCAFFLIATVCRMMIFFFLLVVLVGFPSPYTPAPFSLLAFDLLFVAPSGHVRQFRFLPFPHRSTCTWWALGPCDRRIPPLTSKIGDRLFFCPYACSREDYVFFF